MNCTMAFFGSSLVSAYWNGAATYYRGILRALHARGWEILFLEPDAYERQSNRDIPDPPYAKVHVWENCPEGFAKAIAMARHAEIVVKASGVGVFDEELEFAIPLLPESSRTKTVFWDVDAPATLARLEDTSDPFHVSLPEYDIVLTYGGGAPVINAYTRLGARSCVPIYNAFDPDSHHPAPKEERFACDLAFLGNRMPDREARVDEFFFRAAHLCPDKRFLLAGSGWHDKSVPSNVCYIGHLSTNDHNAFNSTPKMLLNVSRESMARMGYSPATRVFEASAAGACMITDEWPGIDTFFAPGKEILVARDGAEVAHLLQNTTEEDAACLGTAARQHALRSHTYEMRADALDVTLRNLLEEHL